MTDERLETGYAALKTDSDDVPVQVSGIAIGEEDITTGGSGKETLWPRETLEAAAENLEGQPIATDKNHTADGAKAQTPAEAVIGEVTWAGYKPNVGVLYEGEIDDPDIARSVENDRLEVSPLVSREIEPLEDSDEAEFIATEINQWRDLATVVDGAAPSNEITVGENPMKAEALHDAVGELQAEALKEVAGVAFTGTAEGKLDESAIDENFGDHALYGSGENKEDYSYWVVDESGNLRKGNVESAWSLGCRGACPSDDTHDENLRALAEEFDDPPEFVESMGKNVENPAHWEACGLDVPIQNDDGTNGGMSQSSADSGNQETMSDDNTDITDEEREVLSAAESLEEPTKVLEEAAAAEQAAIVEQSEYESLEENVSEVRDVLSEALSEKTELKDSTIEALSFEALCDEFRDEDGELQVEALRQEPETGDPEEGESEALSDDANVEKAEALYSDMQDFGVDHEDTICEALGVSEWDDAIEVLD